MGAIFSSDAPPNEPCFTPDSKYARPAGSRLLQDPRSPTCGIERTPIQVGAAPCSTAVDPRSPSAGVFRTPIAVAGPPHSSTSLVDGTTCSEQPIIDPRSPTAGIARTPIEVLKIQATDLPEPAQGQLPKYELDDAEDDVSEEVVQPHTPCTTATVAGSSGHSCDVALKVASPELIPITTDLVGRPTRSSIKTSIGRTPAAAAKPSPKGSRGIFTDEINSTGSQTPARSAVAAVGATAAVAAPSRPTPALRNADVNSPRHIIQRKQIQKAGMMKQAGEMRSPSTMQLPALWQTAQPAMQDKENERD